MELYINYKYMVVIVGTCDKLTKINTKYDWNHSLYIYWKKWTLNLLGKITLVVLVQIDQLVCLLVVYYLTVLCLFKLALLDNYHAQYIGYIFRVQLLNSTLRYSIYIVYSVWCLCILYIIIYLGCFVSFKDFLVLDDRLKKSILLSILVVIRHRVGKVDFSASN